MIHDSVLPDPQPSGPGRPRRRSHGRRDRARARRRARGRRPGPVAAIFYIHVPIALTSYFCFGLGAWKALLLLWRGDSRYDLESYVAIHQGTIFGALTLITGSIWAKASWGVVDVELEPARPLPRPLPLLLRVLHAPLLDRGRPSPRRSSAVYALFGVVLIPISFLAIRLAEDFIHPTVFTREGRR